MIDIAPDDLVACICEGSTEKTLMEFLIEADLLCFSQSQLLDEKVLPAKYYRSDKRFQDEYLTADYEGRKIIVLVIQDRAIGYALSPPYCEKVKGIYSLLTRPEIEMLMIHALHLRKEYDKVKSKKKPSVFLCDWLKISGARLKSMSYTENFCRTNDLIGAIKEHKRVTETVKGHHFLADVLK